MQSLAFLSHYILNQIVSVIGNEFLEHFCICIYYFKKESPNSISTYLYLIVKKTLLYII